MFIIRNYFILFLLIQTALTAAIVPPCLGQDKNGVAPDTISLPKGPGSIEGLGDAFQPMLNTGSSHYSLAIEVPGGVAGHTPEFSLQYDSGTGSGTAGIGWSAEPVSISRQVAKGIPRYVDSDNSIDDDHDGIIDNVEERDTFLGIDGEELVEVGQDTFRARIENSFIRYRKVSDYWQADLKDGTILTFGETDNARIVDPVHPDHVYRWLLCRSTDVNGNTIEYSYSAIAGSDNKKFIKEIRYGPGEAPWSIFYFLKFSYEEKSDLQKDYRSGFLIQTAHRLKAISVGIQGISPPGCAQGDWNNDNTPDALIGRYVLNYTKAFPNVSHLSGVVRYGADGVNYLPPVRFSYATSNPSFILSAEQHIIVGENSPSSVMDNELVELIDMNRDGLADILKTDFNGSSHTCFLNLGPAEDDKNVIQWAEGRQVSSGDDLAQRQNLSGDQVSLADVNGDGLADLVHTTLADEVYYYINNGDISWSNRKRMSVQDTAPPAPASSSDVITADMDFDKRIDVIRSSENGYTIWFNNAEGKYSRSVQSDGAVYQGRVLLFSSPGTQTADMNGDRLPDVVQVRQNTLLYAANMGHGNFAPTLPIGIPDVLLSDGENSQISRAKLTDINGDGLADLVVERAAANELWFWLNLGNDSLSGRYRVSDMPSTIGSSAVVRWADMNGNGTTDLVYADSSAADHLRILDIGELINGSACPNLLTRIENGLGVTTDIFYKSSTEYYLRDLRANIPWSTTIPFPVQVVSEVQTSTGLDLDTVPGPDVYKKLYSYRDGFYEDREKQFRGFAEVRVIKTGDSTAPVQVHIHQFFTGGPDNKDNDGDGIIDEVSPQLHREEDALKGMIRSLSLEAEDGTLFNRQENSWAVRNLMVNSNGTEVRFAYKEESSQYVYEGQQVPEELHTTYLYDNFGNMTEEKKYGALSISGDEVFTYSSYINDETHWLLGIVANQQKTDASGNKVAETRNYYDGSPFIGLPAGSVDKGLLTRQEGWVSGTQYINLLRNSYDSWGNITEILDPVGSRRTIEYDTDLHIFPVSESIEVGGESPDLQIQAAYNTGLGVLTSSLDFNGRQTVYNYDTFGRPTSFVLPGDSQQFPTRTFSYLMADPQNNLLYAYAADGTLTLSNSQVKASSVISRSREVSGESGTLDSFQYVDGLGRKLARVTEGESGFIVNDAILFNGMGTPRFSFLPYTVSLAEYAPPSPLNPASEIFYDAAGRTIRTLTPPDDNGVKAMTDVSFAPLLRTVTDASGNSRDLFTDGLDQLIRVAEHNLGASYFTGYSYNVLGSLTRIEDTLNNVKTITYDGLGRKVSMEDPDKGHLEYVYDDAGNLIRTTDNKDQVITYSYDGAGRLLTEDFLDSAGINPDVAYHYDQSSEEYAQAENLKGKVARIDDLSGSTFFSYDAQGKTLWTVKRITDHGESRDYRSTLEYDSLGRVTATIFPDGDRVEYQFNNRGLLQSIPNILDSVSYRVSGARSGVQYHNGIHSTSTYDPRERLKSLIVAPDNAPQTPLQSLSYTFDQINNISDITDLRTMPQDSPASASQHFVYDDLYRLVQAQGPGYGRIDFSYDPIGNMIAKQSPDLPDTEHIDDALINLGSIGYGGTAGTSNRTGRLPGAEPGPHAVTSTVSGLSYDYDDNGNMISRGSGDVYQWDFKDRLVQAATADSVSSYVYDYSGQRVIKRVSENGIEETTYYVNDNFEVRDNKQVKFIFDTSQRIARIEGRLTPGGGESSQLVDLQRGWNFFSLELEPDNPAVSTVLAGISGKYSEIWEFDAATQQYHGDVPAGSIHDLPELHGQIGYLIKMTEPATLQVAGVRLTGNITVLSGWNLVPLAADQPLPVTEAFSAVAGQYESVWGYSSSLQEWCSYLPGQPQFLNTLEMVHPAHAYWLNMESPGQLTFVSQPLKIFYYHPDHLGSSSLVTDSSGTVVERTRYYPYGRPRFEERTGFDSAYKYTGKELDRATGLMYYGARYYDAVSGNFLSVDPLYADIHSIEGERLAHFYNNPQKNNLYTMTGNNPINLVDPNGLDDELKVSKKADAQILQDSTAFQVWETGVAYAGIFAGLGGLAQSGERAAATIAIKQDVLRNLPGVKTGDGDAGDVLNLVHNTTGLLAQGIAYRLNMGSDLQLAVAAFVAAYQTTRWIDKHAGFSRRESDRALKLKKILRRPKRALDNLVVQSLRISQTNAQIPAAQHVADQLLSGNTKVQAQHLHADSKKIRDAARWVQWVNKSSGQK